MCGSPSADGIVGKEGRVHSGKDVNVGCAIGVMSREDGLKICNAISISQRQSTSICGVLGSNKNKQTNGLIKKMLH